MNIGTFLQPGSDLNCLFVKACSDRDLLMAAAVLTDVLDSIVDSTIHYNDSDEAYDACAALVDDFKLALQDTGWHENDRFAIAELACRGLLADEPLDPSLDFTSPVRGQKKFKKLFRRNAVNFSTGLRDMCSQKDIAAVAVLIAQRLYASRRLLKTKDYLQEKQKCQSILKQLLKKNGWSSQQKKALRRLQELYAACFRGSEPPHVYFHVLDKYPQLEISMPVHGFYCPCCQGQGF